MHYYSHLNTAIDLVSAYRAEMPFHHYLRQYFASHKKHGSRDRKNIAQLCYTWFRTGRSLDFLAGDMRMEKAITLSNQIGRSWIQGGSETGNDELRRHAESLDQSIQDLISWSDEFQLGRIFDFELPLSDGIDRQRFSRSHLIQPNLFARIRPGAEQIVRARLNEAQLPHRWVTESAVAFLPATALETIFVLNKEIVIQDYSSQLTADYFPGRDSMPVDPGVWDCCAASGGKSLLAWDLIGNIRLTVSDIRESIIDNLKKRFRQAGIAKYEAFVSDVTRQMKHHNKFDLVIADLPCSGSGTWGRTPENLVHFKQPEVQRYADLQKLILRQVEGSVKAGGFLLYITCSVFRAENEDVIEEFLNAYPSFHIVRRNVIVGYEHTADTMFACLLHRSA